MIRVASIQGRILFIFFDYSWGLYSRADSIFFFSMILGAYIQGRILFIFFDDSWGLYSRADSIFFFSMILGAYIQENTVSKDFWITPQPQLNTHEIQKFHIFLEPQKTYENKIVAASVFFRKNIHTYHLVSIQVGHHFLWTENCCICIRRTRHIPLHSLSTSTEFCRFYKKGSR